MKNYRTPRLLKDGKFETTGKGPVQPWKNILKASLVISLFCLAYLGVEG